MLWCTAIDKGYEDPRWLTFNQVNKLGGHVDKGEKAQVVEYWQWEKEVENPDTGEKEKSAATASESVPSCCIQRRTVQRASSAGTSGAAMDTARKGRTNCSS